MSKKILLTVLGLALIVSLVEYDNLMKPENKVNSGDLQGNISGEIIDNNENNNKTNESSGELIYNNEDNNKTDESSGDKEKIENPIVTMEIENLGTVKMMLYPDVAPITVNNFISLINQGFYNGLIFHRVIPGFMAQGGDPSGDGTGGPGYSINGEFKANGVTNNISHKRGVLSMARSQGNDTAGSQFFIVTTDSTYLDGQYAAFGEVIEGMDVIDSVVNSKVIKRSSDIDPLLQYADVEEYIKQMSVADRPVEPPVIKSMTVETFGVQYNEPEKIK